MIVVAVVVLHCIVRMFCDDMILVEFYIFVLYHDYIGQK